MDVTAWVDHLSMPVWFVLTVVFVFLAIGTGMGLNRLTKGHGTEGEIGSVVGATLGLLAFMLAFTFSMAANRFDARKQFFLEEINAIGTAYLRAGLLPQPYATNIRALLREYVDLRVRLVRGQIAVKEAIARSEKIQDQLWTDTEKLVGNQSATISESMFIRSLNEVIDLQEKRVTVGLYFRIPRTIWAGLYAVSGLAMIAVGYQFGGSGARQFLIYTVLALAFSSVILLIADLDRAAQGTVLVNQQPLFNLQKKIHASDP